MAMALRQAPMATTPTVPCYRYMLCFLFLIIALATVSKPALAGHSSPPSTFVIYDHQDMVPPDATEVTAATPSGNYSAFEFGSTFVVANVLREGEAADSPVLGVFNGVVIVEKDLSFYLSVTYVLNISGFTGSISAQGALAAPGNGELAITGGTYDFRWARGYIEIISLSQDPQDTVFKSIFHVKYD